MNILVCVKQVPGSSNVEVDPITGVLKRDGVASKMNPYDLYGIELALSLVETYGGKVETLGLVSGEDMSLNYVALPETTQFCDSFTRDDYVALVKGMVEGTVTVSNDTTAMPATTITVTDHGSVK